MNKAPVGSVVSLYYDSPRIIDNGDVLRTPTGRMYMIVSLRRQQSSNHVGRWILRAMVVDKVPDGANIYPIFWYPRINKSHVYSRQ